MNEPAYALVRLASGVQSVRCADCGETMHPVAGPAAEAEALYVRQLRLSERFCEAREEFVIWDVGLGAGANSLAAIQALRDVAGRVIVVSFDHTLEALRFAVEHAGELDYFGELRAIATRVAGGESDLGFKMGKAEVRWRIGLGDFPGLLATAKGSSGRHTAAGTSWSPSPHVVLFDPFSPARNPEMWTLALFRDLFCRLDPARPCALATYSRTTFVRVSLLLAGFFVGVGEPVAGKEETTIAANDRSLVAKPLDRGWLEKARRSHSAEPLTEPVYRQAPLSPESWSKLQGHPQFH